MKLLYLIILLSVGYFNASAQSEELFKVQQTTISDSSQTKDFKRTNSNFFEDENYVVRKTCSGEWGGSIIFKNKKTGTEYSCNATCPVVVNKIDGKYIVTNTLAHLIGSSGIIQIDNPDSMEVFKRFEPKWKKRGIIKRYVGDDKSRSAKGSKQILDTLRIMILASFPYEGELYHITTDFEKTYVSKVENKRLINLGLVCNESIWTYNPEVIRTIENHYVVYFSNETIKGYLDIFENQIGLMRIK
jgi:hypothetical protein